MVALCFWSLFNDLIATGRVCITKFGYALLIDVIPRDLEGTSSDLAKFLTAQSITLRDREFFTIYCHSPGGDTVAANSVTTELLVHISQVCAVWTEINVVVPRVVVIGPPAAGKGSISRMICKTLCTQHVTMDCLMKESDGKLAAQAKEYCRNGSPIPVDVFAHLVQSRHVRHFHCARLYWSEKLNVKYFSN